MRALFETDVVSVTWKDDGVYIEYDGDPEAEKIGETVEEAIIELRKRGGDEIAGTLERGETYVYGRRGVL